MSTKARSIQRLSDEVYQFYLENGIAELAKKSVPYLAREYIRKVQVSASEIKTISDVTPVWRDKKEDIITIPKPDSPTLRRIFEPYPDKFCPSPATIYRIKNCDLAGPNAIGLYRGKKPISETSGCRSGEVYMGPEWPIIKNIFKSKLNIRPNKSTDTVFPLICPDPSYYHWVMEYLPKLRLYDVYSEHTNNKPTILIESNPRDFVCDTLEFLGYNSTLYKPWDQQNITIENLIVCSHRPHILNHQNPEYSYYNPSVKDLKWTRERARSKIQNSSKSSKNKKRIYISRQKAQRERKICNMEDIKGTLQKFGFESYQLETLSFENQVSLFYDADVIMGPHGAGLLNMMFAENPTVIELFPGSCIKPYFYYISAMFDFNYNALVTKSNKNNLLVDQDELDEFLNLVMDPK